LQIAPQAHHMPRLPFRSCEGRSFYFTAANNKARAAIPPIQ
jgi:hypothetical protein